MQDMNEQEAQSFIKRAEDEPGSTLGIHSWLTQTEVHTQEGNETQLNLIYTKGSKTLNERRKHKNMSGLN